MHVLAEYTYLMHVGGSAFSRATIVSEQGGSVGMDDPNFWSKMLPDDADAAAADAAATAAQKKLAAEAKLAGTEL